jgi:hypothetical protein
MVGIPDRKESAMTKPSNGRRDLNRSTQELCQQLCASELDAVVGGTSKVVKSGSDMKKPLIANFPR